MAYSPVKNPWRPKGGKIYYVAYKDAAGKVVQRTTGTNNLEDAKALLEQWKTEVYTGKKYVRFTYSETQVNDILEKAIKDGRIGPKKGAEYRKLPQAERRVKIANWFKVAKDGSLEYIPKTSSTPGAFPWGDVPKEISSTEDYKLAKGRVGAKIRGIRDHLDKDDLKILENLKNDVVNIKTNQDVIRWENSFNEAHQPLRSKVTASIQTKDWRATARSVIDKDIDSWIRINMNRNISRHFKNHPDVIAGKTSSSTLATQFIDGLSHAEFRAWDEVLRPIKLMNDRWYQVALDSGDPKYLDEIVEAHHLMPVGYEGTALRPTNIAGAQGAGFSSATEHGRQHTPFAKLLYKDYADLGATELHYTPEGTSDIKTKMNAPRWDKKSKKVVYDVLPFDEFVHGVPEYKYDARIDPFRGAGASDAPPHKISLLNLAKRFGGKMASFIPGIGLPFQYQASKGYLSDPSLSDIAKKGKAASVWAGLPGLLGEFLVDWDKAKEGYDQTLFDVGLARKYGLKKKPNNIWT